MPATQDIGRMMQDYAEDAVRMARQLHVEQVEHLLTQLQDGLQSPAESFSNPQANHMAERPVTSGVEDRVDELARVWGGYLGEVVRRRFGGEWTVEKYPAGDFLIVTLNVNGAKLFPAMKIHKRLTNGAADDLLAFYRNVRARLEVLPGGKIQ